MLDPSDVERRVPSPQGAERRRIIAEVAGLLEESDVVRDPSSRQVLLRLVEEAFGGPLRLRDLAVLRPQLVDLVTACIDRTGGLRLLAECLELLEPAGARTLTLLQLSDEWQVFEQFADHDLGWLRGDLSELRVTARWRRFVVECRQEPPPEHCTSLWHLFAHLAVAPSSAGVAGDGTGFGGVPHWLRLLGRLEDSVPAEARQRLRQLIRALADEWDVPEDALVGVGGTRFGRSPVAAVATATAATAAATAAVADGAVGPATAYLVIQFEKYGGDDDTFIMSHWYQWASPTWAPVRGEHRRVRYGDLEAAVDEVLSETERRWAHQAGPVTIEIVLPWQLLNEPVDTWRKELRSPVPSPLVVEYPLVIRSLERLRSPEWHRRWRVRWRGVAADGGSSRIFCAAPDQVDAQLEALLTGDEATVVLVLSDSPLPDSAAERQLLVGVRSGVPAIVWHRDPVLAVELCRVLRSMVESANGFAGGMAQLPMHVAKLRKSAWGEDPSASGRHVGHGFVILWDDPLRQPGQPGSAGDDLGEVRE
ncbi:effector-associated domain 2-containing protein [Micromonospora sp. LOL_015]|uniref:VMAP-C domain-containing protein n=1 Tax=Micromonospora sp. LOL_015 TaxID=3345416 RepID=UPI003A875B36